MANKAITHEGRLERTKHGLVAAIGEFMKLATNRTMPSNTWTSVAGSEVYVRSHRGGPDKCLQLDVATINIHKNVRRRGVMRHVFAELEPLAVSLGYGAIKVENISPHLKEFIAFLEGVGYEHVEGRHSILPCLLKRLG